MSNVRSSEMPSSPSLVVALKEHGLSELRHRVRKLKQEEKDFLAKFEPQEAKPLAKLREFELAAAELDAAKDRLSEYGSNPDGSLPCPICFLRGKNNVLSGDVRSDALHCAICNFINS